MTAVTRYSAVGRRDVLQRTRVWPESDTARRSNRDNTTPIRGILIADQVSCLPGREVQVKRVVRFLILLSVLAAPLIVPPEASAQRRVVRRPAPRSVVYVSARPHYYNYYRPYYYGFYGGYAGLYNWYGDYPFLYGQYPYPYPYPYRRYYYDSSAARIQVEPRHAEVFIDGYFVGLVDDFDGWAQRLNVAPGEHELTIYL